MRLQEFKEGQISVWAETKKDAERFMKAMKENGIKWRNSPYEETDANSNCEYSYGYTAPGLGRATNTRGWYSRQNVPGKPYKSITVAEFFEDSARYTMEDFKAGKCVATFQKDDKKGREAFLNRPELANTKRCDHLDTCGNNTVIYMNAGKGKLCSSTWQAGDLPSVPYTDLLPPDYSFEAFKRGEYAIKFKTPQSDNPEAVAFYKACAERGLDAGNTEYPRRLSHGVYCADGSQLVGEYIKATPRPPVFFSDVPWLRGAVIPAEQITAYRNPDGTVTATYTKDGKVVESATVKRYYTDPDDLRVAAKHALEKMIGEAKPPVAKDYNAIVDRRVESGSWEPMLTRKVSNGMISPDYNRTLARLDAWDAAHPVQPPKPAQPKPAEYKVGDKVNVHRNRDTIETGVVQMTGIPCSWPCSVRLSNGEDVLCAKDKASCSPMYLDYIIGLVESPAPVAYKEGDLVRVRDDLVVGVKYGDDKFVDSMLNSLGKILRLGRKSSCRNAFNLHGWNYTPEMFSGIVASTPPFDKDGKPNYRAGQKIKIRWCENTRVVPIAQVDSTARTEMHYSISNPDGSAHWILDNSVIGLAEETPDVE